MMNADEASEILEIAVREGVLRSDEVNRAIETLREGGWAVEAIEFNAYARSTTHEQVRPKATDAEFLRDMHIVPDLTPRRKSFGRWPTKRRTLPLFFVALLGAWTLSGCANIRVDLGCQSSAPTVTSAQSRDLRKHPLCGLQK